ncbi:MAG: acetoin utilization protein AcuC [Hyphomicrobiales bacterium]|nr:acetoin utilization protein AcuC [Hyphomicrobiales bacterium]
MTRWLQSPLIVHSDVYRRAAYNRDHPLSIPRVETAIDLCRILGWTQDRMRESPVASRTQLLKFHKSDYIDALQQSEQAGITRTIDRETYNIGTRENPVFPGIFDRASTSVGGSILAAELALAGRIAFHPAGGTHHGQPDRANGFCFFNDPVFAILTLLEAGLQRIVYVDLDAHHGDGVEDAFADEPRVFTLSMHEQGRWPGTGRLEDRRQGRARNLPVPKRINDSEFDYLLEHAILPQVTRWQPEALVVTCGTDCLKGDPLSSMELSNVALWRAVKSLTALTEVSVILGGGGYNPWTLARAWAGLWASLCDFPIPGRLPDAATRLLAGLSCDLIDDEGDINPLWLTTLQDAPNPGPVRDAIIAIAKATLAP